LAKLQQERFATEWAERNETSVLLGRISNVYGPGQDLSKQQGLISQLARAAVDRQPIGVYVSLDTRRDYLFAPDCGVRVARAMELLEGETQRSGQSATVVKIFASQRSVSVATILGEIKRVVGRPPRIVVAASRLRAMQVLDLRLRSEVWAEVDRLPLTPIGAGIRTVYMDILRRRQLGTLAAPRPA
jgi:UDP-glucose 4-epimerase